MIQVVECIALMSLVLHVVLDNWCFVVSPKILNI
jgi:hypothetical protein